ncbi:MAG: amidohydrolase family protein [Anaerolineae bacterium]|nr:amidohydrolase family protein [Phycisphaerae bacterium]
MQTHRFIRGSVLVACAISIFSLAVSLLLAQPPSTVPPNGLRDNTPACHALVGAKIVIAPGKSIERGTLVVRDGKIVAVGTSEVKAPADARAWDCTGKTIYAGLIDGFNELPADASKSDPAMLDATGARYWNPMIVPQVRGDRIYKPDAEANKKLRSQGFVARLAAPSYGLLKGTSALISTNDETGTKAIINGRVAQHASLTIPRVPRSERPAAREDETTYPDSPMGAFTLVRQALYDAQWYGQAWKAHEADPKTRTPERNDALDALNAQLTSKTPFIIDAGDELYAMRADAVGREFDLNVIVRGSGMEYRRLSDVAATKRPVLVPVNFTRAPQVASPEQANNVSLEDLMDWDLSAENPARLDKAGVKIALTTHGLRDKGTFLASVRRAVVRGLSPDAALRAMTVAPAELFGATSTHGTLEVGKAGSFVITDGDLFNEKTKVLETWVDGKRFEVTTVPLFDGRGRWTMKLGDRSLIVTISGEMEKLTGKLARERTDPATSPATTRPTTRPAEIDAKHVTLANGRIGFTFDGESLLGTKGVIQVSANVNDSDKPPTWMGDAVKPDGTLVAITATQTATAREVAATQPATQPTDASAARGLAKADAPPTEDQPGGTAQVATPSTQPNTTVASAEEPDEPDADRPRRGRRGGAGREATSKPVIKDALFAVNYPLGDFGRDGLPDQPAAVVFTNATVWTSGPDGIIQNGNVVVERGKITRIFRSQEAVGIPDGATVIDCQGKHISPGIIDCHSHIATDGGVNESGQAITAEVRIGDFINPDDINIYRQLAGGVTSSNILHGSANPIGGQNQVIKLRWGATGEQMKFENAPAGIKFALGENVKQSNWDISDARRTRYPQTRLGVEQIVRDEFKAARDYERDGSEFKADPKGKLPPRRDLELDAIVEILNKQRWIHCHSYRQDEILAMLRVLEDFKVQIGSLQHILEGYKVADAMAKHGATASSFSDWWAYKFEVYDAIPFNGVLMHNAGVNVSFNSDDAELARRLNLEAAKAVKYGGVSEVEALKFVTLNPAKQLRIDKYVGSIEVGKDADIVVWNGSPLSTLGRVEQTWVDGRKYFDRESDAKARAKVREMRVALVQRILTSGEELSDGAEGDRPVRGSELWPNEDIFCGHSEHGHE